MISDKAFSAMVSFRERKKILAQYIFIIIQKTQQIYNTLKIKHFLGDEIVPPRIKKNAHPVVNTIVRKRHPAPHKQIFGTDAAEVMLNKITRNNTS